MIKPTIPEDITIHIFWQNLKAQISHICIHRTNNLYLALLYLFSFPNMPIFWHEFPATADHRCNTAQSAKSQQWKQVFGLAAAPAEHYFLFLWLLPPSEHSDFINSPQCIRLPSFTLTDFSNTSSLVLFFLYYVFPS